MSTEHSRIDPTRSVGWGILGTGAIARAFTKELRLNGFNVAAIGSRALESAESFARTFAVPRWYGSYADLVVDSTVDVVYVATPHAYHCANALLALRNGKHVLVEKPFAINARQARKVIEEGHKRSLLVLEGMWTRFLPHMLRVREIIASGSLGSVRTVIADHGQVLPADPDHRVNNLALGGGALLDLAIYPVSLAVDLLGLPSEVHAFGRLTTTGVDAQTSVLLNYENGSHALLHAALDALGPTRASVIGSLARIEIPAVWYKPAPIDVFDDKGNLMEHWEQPVAGRGMIYQAREVEGCLRRGQTSSSLMPPDQTLAIMEILDRIRDQIGVLYPQDDDD